VLRQIIPTADRTRATVMVKVTILDKDAKLKPEMSAKVTFLAPAVSTAPASSERVVTVPQTAVVTREGKSQVFEIVNGVAQAKAVTLGANLQDRVIVTAGLQGEETLITRPPATLKVGDRVRVKG
jgi:HlyD family secretion protein